MKYDLERAHHFSNNHKLELEQDRKCGCFYCLAIFDPSEIDEWIIEDNPCDERGTAICPYCGIDSVIGESSGFLYPACDLCREQEEFKCDTTVIIPHGGIYTKGVGNHTEFG